MMRALILGLVATAFTGCASLRSDILSGVDWNDQAPRALYRATCDGIEEVAQGIWACEWRVGAPAPQVLVKVPPVQGRVTYSDGLTRQTEDFNWWPEEGFWIWKKRKVSDTWIDLGLAALSRDGSTPVVVDVAGVHKDVGVLSTKGVVYLRQCDGAGKPCSDLPIVQDASGCKSRPRGGLAVCERLSGTGHTFAVGLRSSAWQIPVGATSPRLFVASARAGMAESFDLSPADLALGLKEIQVKSVPKGPALVSMRLTWKEGLDTVRKEGRLLLYGTDPSWTPADRPHNLVKDGVRSTADFVKPVLSDILEVVSYRNGQVVSRQFTTDRVGVRLANTDLTCAYAWSRSSMDLSWSCIDGDGREAPRDVVATTDPQPMVFDTLDDLKGGL